jgi:hypothetical protein
MFPLLSPDQVSLSVKDEPSKYVIQQHDLLCLSEASPLCVLGDNEDAAWEQLPLRPVNQLPGVMNLTAALRLYIHQVPIASRPALVSTCPSHPQLLLPGQPHPSVSYSGHQQMQRHPQNSAMSCLGNESSVLRQLRRLLVYVCSYGPIRGFYVVLQSLPAITFNCVFELGEHQVFATAGKSTSQKYRFIANTKSRVEEFELASCRPGAWLRGEVGQ